MKAYVELISLNAKDIITASNTPCLGQCGIDDNAGTDSDCDGEDNCT